MEHFVAQFADGSKAVSIESPDAPKKIAAHDLIVFGYPVYFSNMPKIVGDFIVKNKACFKGKRIYIIATMALFSGDGTGCGARLLRSHGAEIIGGLHLKMPDCIGDEKALKKPVAVNHELVLQAEYKIEHAAARLKERNAHQEGLGAASHIAGLLGQRLWFRRKTASYKEKPNVDGDKCTGCGKCAALCPMHNISIAEAKAVSGNRCTLCYRCFSHCPTQALTILGKQVYEQCLLQKYI